MNKFIIISPDELPIPQTVSLTEAEAWRKFSQWAKRFQAQGYYRSAEGEAIPLDQLRERCRVEQGGLYLCNRRGADNEFANQCGCDPSNLPTKPLALSTVPLHLFEFQPLIVQADPKLKGQHPYHDHRYITTEHSLMDDESFPYGPGQIIAAMRDCQGQEHYARLFAAAPALLRGCQATLAYLADPPSKFPENRAEAVRIIQEALKLAGVGR